VCALCVCVFLFVKSLYSIHSCTFANSRTSERDFAAAATLSNHSSVALYQQKPEGTRDLAMMSLEMYQFALVVDVLFVIICQWEGVEQALKMENKKIINSVLWLKIMVLDFLFKIYFMC
jgi:hypothetical protein